MKRLSVIILSLLISSSVLAGKQVVTPSVLQLNSDKVELISALFVWGDLPIDNKCVVKYVIWNDTRTTVVQTITITLIAGDFTTLISGFGATLETRLESSIWTDIQNKFGLVP